MVHPQALLIPGRGGAQVIAPHMIANLGLWLDTSVTSSLFQDAARTTPVAADNDPVGGWADLSGNGRHASQSTAGQRALYKTGAMNGRAVLRFAGDDNFYTIGDHFDFPGTAAWTVICVLKPTIDGSFRRVWSKEEQGTPAEGSEFLVNEAVGGFLVERRGNGAAAPVSGAGVSGASAVVACRYDGSVLSMRVNGVSAGSTAATDTAGNTTMPWTIGSIANGAPASCYLGDLAAVFVYERALVVATELAPFEASLMAKWV